MATGNNSGLKKVIKEIGEEAARQTRGFPLTDVRRAISSGWGREIARQLFGNPPRSRRGRR